MQPMDGEAKRERVSVGSLLRACRLRAGVTLADAAETLNIRPFYLHAIEEGRYGDLPGPAYALGFVRGYAEYLGLDGNEVTRCFRAETARTERSGIKEPRSKRLRTKRPGTKAMLHFPLAASETASPKAGILLVGAMIALLAYGGWYALTAGNGLPPELVVPLPPRLAALLPDARIAPETPQTLPRIPESAPLDPEPVNQGPVEQASANPEATKGPQPGSAASAIPSEEQPGLERAATAEGAPLEAGVSEAEPALASHPPVADPAGVAAADRPQVVLQASEESWIEIRDRFNKRVLSRLMTAGERLEVPDETGLRLTVGNAGGIVIWIDGQPVPPLGGPGVVRRNVPLEAARLQHADASAN
jgi:cytoskeleton protein RodZ